ncbi:MAG: SdrD B-like domain-containing protein [Planctomycetota bacterium]
MKLESLETRRLMVADPIHVGLVYIETDYLESDQDVGSDSRGDRFLLSFTGGAPGTQLDQLRIRTDKYDDGLSIGDPMFDTLVGGRGKNGAHGFEVHDLQTTDGSVADVTATVADGGQELILDFRGFEAGDRLEFTIDVDEVLRNSDDLAEFNAALDVITSGQEFQDSILEAQFEAPNYYTARVDGRFVNDFADPWSAVDLDLPPDDGPSIDSRPNRSAAVLASTVQTPIPASISGFVYRDDNDSGTKDPGEIGLAGVPIRLEPIDTIAPQSTRTTTTLVDGSYSFDGLMPGEYRVVEVAQPVDLADGRDSAGTIDGRVVGTAINPGDEIIGVQLAGGDDGIQYNFGELPLGSIAGFVYLTAPGQDCSGDHDATGNTPLAGVSVALIDDEAKVVSTTTTDADGRYQFEDLVAGTYDIVEITPEGLIDGGSYVGGMLTLSSGLLVGIGQSVDGGRISEVSLPPGGVGTDYNFCEVAPASLSGHVYHDRNDDGVRQFGEEGISNTTLQLIDSTGDVVATTFTDVDGFYEFDGLTADVYRIVETQPAGFVDGGDAVGRIAGATVGALGADGDSLVSIDLRQGLHGVDYDFGERQLASLSGRVHVDLDEDCIRDEDEAWLAGVVIILQDQSGNEVARTQTNTNGEYQFIDLVPGQYTVVQLQPDGYFEGGATPGTGGGIATGPSRIEQISLSSGGAAVANDFCERPPAVISGVVHVDRDADCFQDSDEDGIEGVLIELFDDRGNFVASTRTAADGTYSFTNLPAGNYTVVETQPSGYFHGGQVAGSNGGNALVADVISQIPIGWGEMLVDYNFCELLPSEILGQVYVDRDGDCVREPDEPGLGGVIIELYNEAGDRIRTTTTSDDGSYSFRNLQPGTYTVRELQPDGYFHGGQVAGSGGGDDSVEDLISAISLGPGESLTQYDFCEIPPSSIEGLVWNDSQRNNRVDEGEPGLPNVVIELVQDNIVIATTQTNSDGRYVFDELRPGQYEIRESQPNGYFHGGQIVGSVGGDVISTDVLGNIDLPAGTDAVDYDFPELPPAAISGFVFQDGEALPLETPPDPVDLRSFRDGQLTGDDDRLGGVTLELRNVLGLPVDAVDSALPGIYPAGAITTITDSNGYYEFTGLRPGATYAVYQVQPDDYIDSLDTPGDENALAANEADLATSNDLATTIQRLSLNAETDPNFDAILNLFVSPGQRIANNNFSEIQIDPPVLPPPESPTDEPQRNAQVPIDTFITTERVVAFGQPIDILPPSIAIDEWAVSWHLSVINGGFPRGEKMLGDDAVAGLVGKDVRVRVVAYRSGENGNSESTSIEGLPVELLAIDLSHGRWSWGTSTHDVAPRPKSPIDSLHAKIETMSDDESIQLGHRDAVALTGDFDGNGVDEAVLFIGGQWFVDLNGNGVWDRGDLWIRLGTELDRPVVGDWDGDGKDDIGIFGRRWEDDERRIRRDPGLADPANYRRRNLTREELVARESAEDERRQRVLARGRDGQWLADAVDHVFQYGEQVDVPLAGDWKGVGIDQIGVFRSGQWLLDEDGDGRWTRHDQPVTFGQPGDEPIVGDFDGDGIDEIGVVRGDEWIIDTDGDRRLTGNDQRIQIPRDSPDSQPVVGDFDGDKKDEPGYYDAA